MKIVTMLAVAVMASAITVSAADGKECWEKSCAKCHGSDGKGDTKMGKKLEIKDLTDAKLQAALKDEQIVKAIKEGITEGGKTRMKAIEGISDEDVKAVSAYVRTLKK
jgi:cytochrome c553